ncbi:MAG TPA: A/G-specific adenine glycosylase, partial [Thermoanaerobaculia bacterium]|nr:A/G-specific adenine glycosylase [Thermoanaerobaculia bacterium]
ALLRWYRRERRDLPFRRTSDPWAIWVSETILQQTTVAAGVPRWESFLSRFPTVSALAAAEERDILAEWSGLGYYERARNLHRAARLVEERGGSIPRSVEELRALPGIGPYTAAAVASIAFGVSVAAVDGNVARVLARLHAIPGDPRTGASRTAVAAAASAFLNRRSPGDHNQALMELGALVCLPRSPRCQECPLARDCRALASGHPEAFPRSRPRKPTVSLRLAAGLARRRGRVVLVDDVFLVPGHLVVPLIEVAPGVDAGRALAAAWPRLAGRPAARLTLAGTVRHAVLERRYSVGVFEVTEASEVPRVSRGPATPGAARPRLFLPEELEKEARGGLLRKVLALSAPDPGAVGSSRRARALRGPAPPKPPGG